MTTPSPVPLIFPPGVQRDGTMLDSDTAVDSEWCRWRLGRPRKIGGYKQAADILAGPGRKAHVYYSGANIIVHVGTSRGLQQIVLDRNGDFVSTADRTPATFAGGIDAGWTLDALFDAAGTTSQLIAHSAPDIATTASLIKTTPFLGQIDSTTPLVPFTNPTAPNGIYTQPSLAGGILCTPPYVWGFDTNGFIQWSAPNLPNYLGVSKGTSGAGNARISANKIITGALGPQSPSAFFWTLDELIGATFVGGAPVWDFATVTRSSSLLSSNVVVEYDNLFFWAGMGRFLVFNGGSMVEVPNKFNQDWFFDNINWTYAAKAHAFKVPRYGEIWFCAPLFGATECSHAAIFNVRENTWYDTVLPEGGIGCGKSAGGFPYPLTVGVRRGTNGFSLWVNEFGTDKLVNATPTAIRSYFETPIMGGTKNQQADNAGISVELFEADMVQTGDMSISVIGGANQRAPIDTSAPVTLRETPQNAQDQILGLRVNHRQLRLHIESNTLGGNYIVGRNLAHMEKTDGRFLG